MSKKEKMIFVLILFFGFLVRIFLLENIPSEIWGDVNEHFIYAKEILKGNFKFDFWGGDGPLFDYWVALIFKIFGRSFETIKLSSVLIGVFTIFTTYLYAQELFKNKKIGLFASFFTAFSFWSISLSRQAKPYILTPLFLSLFLYFFIKKRYFWAGFFLGVGMWTQASFWGLFFLSFFNWQLFIFSLIFSFPLFWQMIFLKDNYFGNGFTYLGEKFGFNLNIFEKVKIVLWNFLRNFWSFFLKGEGDPVFRHNIPYRPTLDFLTAIFFLLGLFFLIKETFKKENRKKYILYLFLPFYFGQMASNLDMIIANTPSIGRMLTISPVVYTISSFGLYRVYEKIKKNYQKILFLCLSLFFIFLVNIFDYFFVYPKTLPNGNLPFSLFIKEDILKEKKEESFYLIGCCWGEWAQPESKSILNRLDEKRQLVLLNKEDIFGNQCDFKKGFYYFNPNDFDLINYLKSCNLEKKLIFYKINNVKIFGRLKI